MPGLLGRPPRFAGRAGAGANWRMHAYRLTATTTEVFQNWVEWSPAGDRLLVVDYDYPTDTEDLMLVTWPAGEWRQITDTPGAREGGPAFTPDGNNAVVATSTVRRLIVATPVRDLLAGANRRTGPTAAKN